MVTWSIGSDPLEPPAARVDIYQSRQRLEPGAWVAAHTHDGPESGIVTTGEVSRYAGGAIRAFAPGAAFITPAGHVHATGNRGDAPAEAITLHILRAGSSFSTPCACADAPQAQPGSSNPTRSIFRDVTFAFPMRAEHACFSLESALSLPTPKGGMNLVTVLGGSVAFDGRTIASGESQLIRQTQSVRVEPAGIDCRLLVSKLIPLR